MKDSSSFLANLNARDEDVLGEPAAIRSLFIIARPVRPFAPFVRRAAQSKPVTSFKTLRAYNGENSQIFSNVESIETRNKVFR